MYLIKSSFFFNSFSVGLSFLPGALAGLTTLPILASNVSDFFFLSLLICAYCLFFFSASSFLSSAVIDQGFLDPLFLSSFCWSAQWTPLAPILPIVLPTPRNSFDSLSFRYFFYVIQHLHWAWTLVISLLISPMVGIFLLFYGRKDSSRSLYLTYTLLCLSVNMYARLRRSFRSGSIRAISQSIMMVWKF